MGGYLSSDYDSKIKELEQRLNSLENPQAIACAATSPVQKRRTIERPSWHNDLIKEIHTRRKSIEGEK